MLFQVFAKATSSAGQETVLSSEEFEPIKQKKFEFASTVTRDTMSRHIVKSVLSREQSEGVGARVRRSVGRPEVNVFRGCGEEFKNFVCECACHTSKFCYTYFWPYLPTAYQYRYTIFIQKHPILLKLCSFTIISLKAHSMLVNWASLSAMKTL